CDICQDVCPWNRKAPVARLAAFQPRQRLARAEEAAKEDAGGASLCEPGLEWLAALTQEEFSAQFRRSACWTCRARIGRSARHGPSSRAARQRRWRTSDENCGRYRAPAAGWESN